MTHKLGCNVWWGKDIPTQVETIKILAQTGFETVMLPVMLEDRAGMETLVKATLDAGMTIDELHAPFSNINRIWYDDQSGDAIVKMLLDSVDMCADMKVDTMVFHESANRVGPDMSNAGLNRLAEIICYAKEKGVRPAIENVRRTNYIARIIHENKDNGICYCWDCGHELCYTPGVNHVALFPEKLVCTHIHDNSGIYMNDDHWLPFDGNTNWEEKARHIRQSGYRGALTLEVGRDRARYADLTDEQFAKRAFERLTRFAEMCK